MDVHIATSPLMSGSTKLKVLVIPSWYPCEESPYQALFLREQAICLARRFDVSVLTPRFPSLRDFCRLRWGPEFSQEEDHGVNTLRVRYLKSPTFRRWIPILAHPDHALIYYRKFAAAIRNGFDLHVAEHGLPDVIHAHVVQPAGWIAVELGQIHDIPVVLTEHSGPFDMHLQTDKQRSLVREILRRADRLVAVSPALRDAMTEFEPDARIDVIGNLIDTEFFTPAVEDRASGRPFRFFYLGVFVEIKGVRHLLHAIHELQARGLRDFEVHLGGDGPLGPTLKRLAADLGIADRCRFLGMLSREEVRDQMRACDVFVLPSLGETFGIVNGEAMACGKPVLSTRCGGPEFVVTPETGILVSPGNPHELADAMASFLKRDRAFDSELIRASAVARFGAEAFLDKTEAVYSALDEGHSMRSFESSVPKQSLGTRCKMR
jgi:glycosyltransferase involved in cell wall biosynthesis